MQINVTQEDIKKGVPGSVSNCPVARALKRDIKSKNIAVGFGTARIKPGRRKSHLPLDEYGWQKIDLPQFVTDFIIQFDSNKNVVPVSFEIDYE